MRCPSFNIMPPLVVDDVRIRLITDWVTLLAFHPAPNAGLNTARLPASAL